MTQDGHEANYYKYCKTCKYHDSDPDKDNNPCNLCLTIPFTEYGVPTQYIQDPVTHWKTNSRKK